MEEIILYVSKKYGLLLSESEAKEFINWFKLNEETLVDEKDMDIEARKYLHSKYSGRPIYAMEEDLSNMEYLLALFKKQTKGE